MAIQLADGVGHEWIESHWCPYTGMDGAKAIQEEEDYRKSLDDRYGYGNFDEDEHFAGPQKNHLRVLKMRARSARCKGLSCPKAQIVRTNASPVYQFFFCGGDWKG